MTSKKVALSVNVSVGRLGRLGLARSVSLKKGPKLVISIFHLFKIQFEKAHFFSLVLIF